MLEPGEGAFDHPAPLEHGELGQGWRLLVGGAPHPTARLFDNLHAPAQDRLDPLHQLAALARIGPEVAQFGKALGGGFKQGLGPVAIGDSGRVHLGTKH